LCAPSKSYNAENGHRSYPLNGASKISNPLLSEDTEVALPRCHCTWRKSSKLQKAAGPSEGAKALKGSEEPIDCGESGATLAFHDTCSRITTDSSILVFRGSIEKRPVEPLLASLKRTRRPSYIGQKLDGLDAVFVEGSGMLAAKHLFRAM